MRTTGITPERCTHQSGSRHSPKSMSASLQSDIVAAQQRNDTMGHEETSIVRLNDAAIVDGDIIAAIGPLLEHHL